MFLIVIKNLCTKKGDYYIPFLFLLFTQLALIGVLFNPITSANPNKYISDSDKNLEPGIFLIVTHQYNEAKQFWKKIEKDSCQVIESLFYQALTLLSEMEDRGSYDNSSEFFTVLQLFIKSSSSILEKFSGDLRLHYYIGNAHGIASICYYRQKKWLKSYQKINESLAEYEWCLNKEPEFLEPCIGKGMYIYYKNKISNMLGGWLPFFQDEREKGISLIRKGIQPGYTGFMARYQLAWIYLDYKDYENAISVAKEGLHFYPESRFFLWPLAEAYKSIGEWDKAYRIFNEITTSMERDNYTNEYNFIKSLIRSAQCALELKLYSIVEKSYHKIRKAEPSPAVRNKAEWIYDQSQELFDIIKNPK